MRVLDIGIIGSGAIAKVHANCVQFFDKTNLVGIVCTDPLRSRQLEEDFNCIVYNNEETLLEQSLDAVIVCNESGKHGQSIIRAANAKKHILCEKHCYNHSKPIVHPALRYQLSHSSCLLYTSPSPRDS